MAKVKLIMTWDIRSGREEDYFEFHIRKFIPTLDKLGVKLSEAWLTVYGEDPRIMAEATMGSLSKLQGVLNSPDWEDLGVELDDFVENFEFKVVPAGSGFQM